MTKGHLFFVSYARANTAHPDDLDLFNRFIGHLKAEVSQNQLVLPLLTDFAPAFVDRSDIEVGQTWPDALHDGLETSLAALSLYSPNYFNSPWCGKEFQVFLDRRNPHFPIVPVWWTK